MFFANVEDFGDGGNVAVHRINAFERDELGAARLDGGEQAVEIFRIVMLEFQALRAAMANAFDHRSVVECIGQDDAIGEARREGAKRCPVGNIAAGKNQRGFFVVEVGQFGFEQHMLMARPRNIARAACARAAAIKRVVHRVEDFGMLAHAEIVVRAPDGDVLDGAIVGIAPGTGERATLAFEFGKHPVITGFTQSIQLLGE